MAGIFGLVLLATIVLNELIHYDFWFQDLLYSKQKGIWLYDIHSSWNRNIFYHGAKILLGILGVGGIVLLIKNRKNQKFVPYRKGLSITILTLIICPLFISSLKNWSAIRCPSQIGRYSGPHPYEGLFDLSRYQEASNEWGRCFPAGHASGGLALVALMNFSEEKKKSFLLSMSGATFGWIMGWHQMLRGAHFLSHTLASMWTALIICYLLEYFWERHFSRKKSAMKL